MDEEQGMLRMSFLEHLNELRSRIIKALVGFGVVFIACMAFSDRLWLIVQAPAVEAFRKLGIGRARRHQRHGAVRNYLDVDAAGGVAIPRLALDSLPGLGVHRAWALRTGA